MNPTESQEAFDSFIFLHRRFLKEASITYLTIAGKEDLRRMLHNAQNAYRKAQSDGNDAEKEICLKRIIKLKEYADNRNKYPSVTKDTIAGFADIFATCMKNLLADTAVITAWQRRPYVISGPQACSEAIEYLHSSMGNETVKACYEDFIEKRKPIVSADFGFISNMTVEYLREILDASKKY